MQSIKNKYFENLTFEDKVLYLLCCYDCHLCMHTPDFILTTGTASRILNCSAYKVRKVLKQLEKDGLAQRVCEGGCGEEELYVWCIKGWTVTQKTRLLDIFKKANWEESKVFRDIFFPLDSDSAHSYYKTNTYEWHEKTNKLFDT